MGDEMKKITDLSDDQIRYIVNEIFKPKEIKNIERDNEWECVTCNITTTWNGDVGEGEDEIIECEDELELKDPFEYGSPLRVDFSISCDDVRKYKQLCFAFGIFPNWLSSNKYIRNLTFEMVIQTKESNEAEE